MRRTSLLYVAFLVSCAVSIGAGWWINQPGPQTGDIYQYNDRSEVYVRLPSSQEGIWLPLILDSDAHVLSIQPLYRTDTPKYIVVHVKSGIKPGKELLVAEADHVSYADTERIRHLCQQQR